MISTSSCYIRAFSTINAPPMAPAAHPAMTPYFSPVSTSRLQQVVRSRAPVAPKGCPRDSEPPYMFNLFILTLPALPGKPSFSRPNLSDSRHCITPSICAAKASCISMTPRSENFSPAFFNAARNGKRGPEQELFPQVLTGKGVGSDIALRFEPERLGFFLTHQHGDRGPVGQEGGIGRCHGAVPPVECAPELG